MAKLEGKVLIAQGGGPTALSISRSSALPKRRANFPR